MLTMVSIDAKAVNSRNALDKECFGRGITLSSIIIEAADYIAEFIAETDFEAFQKSELLRSAVVQKLSVIGAAVARRQPTAPDIERRREP